MSADMDAAMLAYDEGKIELAERLRQEGLIHQGSISLAARFHKPETVHWLHEVCGLECDAHTFAAAIRSGNTDLAFWVYEHRSGPIAKPGSAIAQADAETIYDHLWE